MRRQFEIENRARKKLHEACKGAFKVVVDTQQLKQILAVCNLSQRELAKRAGVSYVTVCYMANGKHSPNIDTLEKVTRVLVRELNKGYGGNLNRQQLVDLLNADTSQYRKGKLWAVLSNDTRR